MAYTVQDVPLHCPPLEEVAEVFKIGAKSNFEHVEVAIVDCPDLTKAPFGLTGSGLGGSARLLDVGGVPYLTPVPNLKKIYNMRQIAKDVGLEQGFFIGSGAASHRLAGLNCELIADINMKTGDIGSHFAKISHTEGKDVLQHYDSHEFALLCNLLATEGLPGKVIHVRAAKRISDANFVSCLRLALQDKYGAQPVGVGGVFVMQSGKAKVHIMPDFSATPLVNDADVAQWLRFFIYDSPLVCLSTFISHDPGYQLRMEHTHCFSDHGVGGHYHYDATPADVAYEGYFVVAERLFRVDEPPKA